MIFDETKHPRDDEGKFTEKNEFRQNAPYSEIVKQSEKWEDTLSKSKDKNRSVEDFFGEEFKGYKGRAAIEKLLTEKRGHVKNAFERSEVGSIDLVWGDDTGGIAHVIKRRNKMLENGAGKISGIEMAKKIPDIIENGVFAIGRNDRPIFKFEGYIVAIKPTYDGKKLNWVLSAMEEIK